MSDKFQPASPFRIHLRRGRISPRDWQEFGKLARCLVGGGFAQSAKVRAEDATLVFTVRGSEMLYYLHRLQKDLERTPLGTFPPLGKTGAKQLLDLASSRLRYEVI